MIALFPTALLPSCLSKPQLSFPPLKTNSLNTTLTSSSKPLTNTNSKILKPQTQKCSTLSTVSPCEDTLLLSDWTQLLKISIESRDFLLGQAIHAFLVKLGSHNDTFEGNNLLNLYGKFNRLDLARRVFDEVLIRNTITWTSLIKGYFENEDFQSGFSVVYGMHKFGEKFNEHTCTVILQACSSAEDQTLGEQVHGFIIKSGFEGNVYVSTALVSVYSRSGYLTEALKIFNSVASKDVQLSNLMILEYGKAGHGEKAIGVFKNLLSFGVEPNDYTFTNIISTCNGELGIEEGKQLQGLAVKYGFLSETSVGNVIITMYGNNGMIKEAERMFSAMSEKNFISWSALISGYTRNGYGEKAFAGFLGLHDLGVSCDSSLLATVLDCCSQCDNIKLGFQIHGLVIKLGYPYDVNIGTALVDLYAKSRNLQSARTVFNGLSNKNIASFNAILAAFTENNGDKEQDPMTILTKLRLAGIKPDCITFSRLLSLCANQASIAIGRSLQAYTIKIGLYADLSVANAVITMYAKCGSIEDAYQMFNAMNGYDSVSWNTIISAYALHGQSQKALLLFEEMKKKGFSPDEISILAILQVCAYCGLWEEGISLFNVMETKYRIQPLLEHYACRVDLLGRAGYLSEAMGIIYKSPFQDSSLLWRTLVNASMLCGDLNFGKFASKQLLDLSPKDAGSYILVSKLYAGAGMLDEAARVRAAMNDLKLSKEAGSSWIEINDKIHHFVANGNDHPESREIYARLELLTNEMRWNDSADPNGFGNLYNHLRRT